MGTGGSLPDGSTTEVGGCSCSGVGATSEILQTSLDCYCSVNPCLRLDEALTALTMPRFACVSLRRTDCGRSEIFIPGGAWPSYQFFDSSGTLVGVIAASDQGARCPFDRTQVGLWLQAGTVADGCSLTDCTLVGDCGGDASSLPGNPPLCPSGTGGAGGTIGTGGADGGATTFPCNHIPGTGGTAGDDLDAAGLDDTCVAGQTFCRHAEIRSSSSAYKGICIPIPPVCDGLATCGCLGPLTNCRCAGSGNDLVETCDLI
jgi:hypothetical protein